MLNSEEVKLLLTQLDELGPKISRYIQLRYSKSVFPEDIGYVLNSVTWNGFSVSQFVGTVDYGYEEYGDSFTYEIPWRLINDYGGLIHQLETDVNAKKKLREQEEEIRSRELYAKLKARFEA